MEAEIIHAVGVCFDVRERPAISSTPQACGVLSYHPRRRRVGVWDFVSLGSRRPVWVKRWILWRRYWKYACLTRNSNTSSMTAEKYARERIVPSGGAPGARKIRRAAAKTNAFSTAARGTPRACSWAARRRSGWRMVPAVPGVWRSALSTFWIYSSRLMGCSSTGSASALRVPQRRTVDGHCVAVVPHAAQQRVHHRLVAQKIVPLVIHQIRRDDSGVAMIALFHQLEEGVRLFGFEIQIAELVDQQDIQTGQAIQQPARGPVG